jgi:hypothetical protein
MCGKKIGETPVLKKANRPPRFTRHPILSKLSCRFDQLHAYHQPVAPSKDVPPGQDHSR